MADSQISNCSKIDEFNLQEHAMHVSHYEFPCATLDIKTLKL